jgi:hypothetical protein
LVVVEEETPALVVEVVLVRSYIQMDHQKPYLFQQQHIQLLLVLVVGQDNQAVIKQEMILLGIVTLLVEVVVDKEIVQTPILLVVLHHSLKEVV